MGNETKRYKKTVQTNNQNLDTYSTRRLMRYTTQRSSTFIMIGFMLLEHSASFHQTQVVVPGFLLSFILLCVAPLPTMWFTLNGCNLIGQTILCASVTLCRLLVNNTCSYDGRSSEFNKGCPNLTVILLVT